MSDCTCLSEREVSQMMTRGETMQTRYPCPVHGDGSDILRDIELLPRIQYDGLKISTIPLEQHRTTDVEPLTDRHDPSTADRSKGR